MSNVFNILRAMKNYVYYLDTERFHFSKQNALNSYSDTGKQTLKYQVRG